MSAACAAAQAARARSVQGFTVSLGSCVLCSTHNSSTPHPPCHAPQEEAQPAEAAQQAPAPAAASKPAKKAREGAAQAANKLMDAAGVSLGPIGLTVGSDLKSMSLDEEDGGAAGASGRPDSYASLTTAEWRALYEKEGRVDLWVQEEFNSGSRLVVSG